MLRSGCSRYQFHSNPAFNQQYLPQDKLLKHLETAMIEMGNLCGVDVNEAMGDPHTGKAAFLIKGINSNVVEFR